MRAYYFALPALGLLVACASGPSGPAAGMELNQLVRYECEGGKSFQARVEDGFKDVRLRTHEGSVNVTHTEGDVYKGEEWTLYTAGANGIALQHKDKVVAKNCKKSV